MKCKSDNYWARVQIKGKYHIATLDPDYSGVKQKDMETRPL